MKQGEGGGRPPKKPEILSPAGDFEKLKSALLFGADAVYFSGKNFGMRSAAGNFSLGEIEQACLYTHARKKKLYLTVNTIPGVRELEALKCYLNELKGLAELPDAAICADIGVVALVKETLPALDIHISTQANVQNQLSCLAWAEYGAKRIILSRELGFDDIRAIKEAVGDKVELECFVHGAMCMAYSGRCFLSNYLAGRDSNRGACAQPCRWKYSVVEEKRPGQYLPVFEDEGEGGTQLFSSKDLCMVEHVDDLALSGIDAFKIEGRMKSAYYAACITNAYRQALDGFCETGKMDEGLIQRLKGEAESVSRREYGTGYFYSPPHAEPSICEKPGYIQEKTYLGLCVGFDRENALATFEQRNKVELGQKAQILSPSRTGDDIQVQNLQDAQGNPIGSAPHPGMVFRIKIDESIKKANGVWRSREIEPGDMLRSL